MYDRTEGHQENNEGQSVTWNTPLLISKGSVVHY